MNGTKVMIIRGAEGRKLLHGKVKGVVTNAFYTEKLTAEECRRLIKDNAEKLQLSPFQIKRWSGKRYLFLVELKDVISIEPFSYKRTKNMDHWIIVDDINSIKNSLHAGYKVVKKDFDSIV